LDSVLKKRYFSIVYARQIKRYFSIVYARQIKRLKNRPIPTIHYIREEKEKTDGGTSLG